ncbi:MAG: hypothetical protein E7566_07870 [Ruminococcaceae bacterium]|nr:hypothetical protein [Oscillospiraceae bacterium]
MQNIFLTILNISITASYIALAAIVLRMLLKRNPKWITCILWALLAIRLLVPFSFESKLSLIPSAEPVKSESVISSSVEDNYQALKPQTPVIEQEAPDSPQAPVIEQENPNSVQSPVTPITPEDFEDNPAENITPNTPQDSLTEEKEEENTFANIFPILSYVWAGGVLLMLLYSVISFVRLKRRVRASFVTDKNIYICDDISTPFILGIIKPRIYLPSALSGDELEYITSHEKAHLKRLDHLWKPLGFVLLSVHWFNPLMWISYILLCRDIELACDEKVLKDLGTDSKKQYSQTLLTFSTERKLVSACPLAFGEVGVKQRIINILNYKKPAFWVILLSLLLCLAIGLCFLTNPVSKKEKEEVPASFTEYGIKILDSGSDIEGVSLELLDINLRKTADSNGYIEIKWNNENNESYTCGEPFFIYQEIDPESGWVDIRTGESAFTLIGYIIPEEGSYTHKYSLWNIDITEPGTYRFESTFSRNANETFHTERKAWIVFEITKIPEDIKNQSEESIATLPIDKLSEGYLKYTYRDENRLANISYLKLYPKESRFEFSLHPASSYLPMGTYKIEGDRLILQCEDGDANKYVFEFTSSYHLSFCEDESSELPKYKYSANDTEATPPFKDKAVFKIELSRTAEDREEVIPYTYEEIIETIIAAHPWKEYNGSSPLPDFPYASYKYISHNELSEIGYALIDIDSNGVEELIITSMDQRYVYDAYTMIDSKTVHLFTSGDRYFHKLYEDGYIHLTWSGGSTLTGHDFMKLSDGRIEFIERITIDAYYAADLGLIKEDHTDIELDDVSFKSKSENEEDYVHIAYDELTEILNSYKQKTELEYSLTPLSEYKSGDIRTDSYGNRLVHFDIDGDGDNEICDIGFKPQNASDFVINGSEQYYLIITDNGETEYKVIYNLSYNPNRDGSPLPQVRLIKANGNLYVILQKGDDTTLVYKLEISGQKITAIEVPSEEIPSDHNLRAIRFDIDKDGEDEHCSLSFPALSSTQNVPLFLLANDNGLIKQYEIPDIQLNISEASNIHLKKSGDFLYVFIEKSIGTKTVVQLVFNSNDTISATAAHLKDVIYFDIDGDGKKEELSINDFNIYSQDYPFSITVNEYGVHEYYSEFVLPQIHDLSFQEKDDKLYVICTSLDDNPLNYKYQVLFENGGIVLDQNGERLPEGSYYAVNNLVVPEFEEYSTQWAQDHIIDQMAFDIDKDGKDEDVIIGAGGTYGIFTFRIIAFDENEEIEYNSFFTGKHMNLSFQEDEDGNVYLKGETDEYVRDDGEVLTEAESHKFDLKVEFNQINIYKNGTKLPNHQIE